MALSEADLGRIGRYVRAELPQWMDQIRPSRIEGQLLERMVRVEERMVRVEENLSSQRELLIEMQRGSDRRFDDVNRRFDGVNRRFEDANRRFEDQNKRFDAMRWWQIATIVVLSTMMTLYQFLA